MTRPLFGHESGMANGVRETAPLRVPVEAPLGASATNPDGHE